MPGLNDLVNMWKTIKEVDLRPLRDEALRGVKIAIVGKPGSGKRELANRMRRDPQRPHFETATPILIVDLDEPVSLPSQVAAADLIILMIKAETQNAQIEHNLAHRWVDSGKKVLLVINTATPESVDATFNTTNAMISQAGWNQHNQLVGDIGDGRFLVEKFSPKVIDMLPDQLLTLGRSFPLFRLQIGREMVSETCFTNAAYAVSTGLAEIVPALAVPLNVADMFVLSKTQAFLVYKLGLTLGFSTHWQDYVKEFSGILGSGFFWRQVARQLIGLIPGWGIIPKVAVSYAGTYVVGNVVLQWYLTGRHLSKEQIRQLYSQAFQRGKNLAGGFKKMLPKPKPKSEKVTLANKKKWGRPTCPTCGKRFPKRAHYCQHCGTLLGGIPDSSGKSDDALVSENDDMNKEKFG